MIKRLESDGSGLRVILEISRFLLDAAITVLIVVLVALACTTAVNGAERGVINCQLVTYDTARDTLTLRCPSAHIFSPLRVVLTLTGSATEDREFIDVSGHPQVKFLVTEGYFQVRLPHSSPDRCRRWLAWRRFATLVRIRISEEQSLIVNRQSSIGNPCPTAPPISVTSRVAPS